MLENTSAWGTLPSAGRCGGVALGWKPPRPVFGLGSWAPELSPPGIDALKGKLLMLPGFPEPQARLKGGFWGWLLALPGLQSLQVWHCRVPPPHPVCSLGVCWGLEPALPLGASSSSPVGPLAPKHVALSDTIGDVGVTPARERSSGPFPLNVVH